MMMLWWLLGLVLVALVVAWLVRARWPTSRPSSAQDEVRRRYARGEIDRDTYERLLQDLRPNNHMPATNQRTPPAPPACPSARA